MGHFLAGGCGASIHCGSWQERSTLLTRDIFPNAARIAHEPPSFLGGPTGFQYSPNRCTPSQVRLSKVVRIKIFFSMTPLELNRPFSVGIWPTPPFFWRMPNAAWRSHALSPPDASARGREDFFLARCDFVLKSVLLSHRRNINSL